MIRSVMTLIGITNLRFGQGLGLPPEIVKSVAALKLLQPALCVRIDGKLFTGIEAIWAATGVGP